MLLSNRYLLTLKAWTGLAGGPAAFAGALGAARGAAAVSSMLLSAGLDSGTQSRGRLLQHTYLRLRYFQSTEGADYASAAASHNTLALSTLSLHARDLHQPNRCRTKQAIAPAAPQKRGC